MFLIDMCNDISYLQWLILHVILLEYILQYSLLILIVLLLVVVVLAIIGALHITCVKTIKIL